MIRKTLIVLITVCCASAYALSAQNPYAITSYTIATQESHRDTTAVVKKDNIFKRFVTQLLSGHKDRTFERAIDISFAIYPYYSTESSVGIGAAVTGLYRTDRTDSITPPSDAQLFGNVTFKGQYGISVKGNHYFNSQSRMNYGLYFNSLPLDFWGITYEACKSNAESYYTRRKCELDANYYYSLAHNIYIGASLNISYNYLSRIGNVAYLQGQKESYFLTGVGISVSYDSRDFIPNPKRGLYILLKEMYYPGVLGTAHQEIFTTTLIMDYYIRMWSGSLLAFDLMGQYSGTHAPWPLRAEIGAGNSRMRGYYEGRYIDNNMLSAQMELRQKIYKRLGCVAWVGCGAVFPSFKELHGENFMINYGVGLRFEIKHNVNFRIDCGFGKDSFGVLFSFGEAF